MQSLQERMSLMFLYEKDTDPKAIDSRRFAVLGYGSQGRSQALNLRDRGLNVLVAQRSGGVNHEKAIQDGFKPIAIDEAVRCSDFIIMALPDDAMGEIFVEQIAPALRPGCVL